MAGELEFPVVKSDEDWQRDLSSAEYQVLRRHGTEQRGTSPLNTEKRSGVFTCAGCGQPLFSSDTKFESGTGWPSFFAPIKDSVATTTDRSHFMTAPITFSSTKVPMPLYAIVAATATA